LAWIDGLCIGKIESWEEKEEKTKIRNDERKRAGVKQNESPVAEINHRAFGSIEI